MSFSLATTRFDPRTFICLTLLYALSIILSPSFSITLALFLFAIGLALLFQIPFCETLKKLALIDGFMLLALFSLPLTYVGGEAVSIWGLPFYLDGFWLAVSIALKANGIFLCFSALMGRMGVAEFAHALAHMKVPLSFVQILLLMVRYLDVLTLEFERLRTAMKCRGFRARSNWHSWQSLGYLCGMLFVRSLERAEQILIAMKCRGFQGTYPLLHHFHFSLRDIKFSFLFIIGLVVFICSGTYFPELFMKEGFPL